MEKHSIVVDGVDYELCYDKYTGDWSVYSEEDPQVQQEWLLTEKGAINYIMHTSGVRENDDYQRAPDRC